MIRKGYETPREKLEASVGEDDDGEDSDSPLGRQYSDSAQKRMAEWAEREKEELTQSSDPTQWPSGQLLGEGALSPEGSSRGSPRSSNGSAGSPRDHARRSPRSQLTHVTKQQRDSVFQHMDVDGDGALSLTEVHKAVGELWPKLNHKEPIKRAFMAAGINSDRLIGRREFRVLLKNLVFFNNLWTRFEVVDKNHDNRLDLDEFKDASGLLNITVATWKAEEDFARIDEEGAGFVTFDEFCSWCAERNLLGCKSDSDSEDENEYIRRSKSRTPRGSNGSKSKRASRGRYSSSESESDEDVARYRARRSSSGRKTGRRGSDGERSLPSYDKPVPRSEYQTDAYLERVLKQMETDAAVQIQAAHRGKSTRKGLHAEGRLPSQRLEQAQQEQQPQATFAETTRTGSNTAATVVPPPVPTEATGQQPPPAAAAAAAAAVTPVRAVVVSSSPRKSIGSQERRGSTGNQLVDIQRALQDSLQKESEQRDVIDKLTALLGNQRSKAATERQRHKEEKAELRRAVQELKREVRHLEDKMKRAGRPVSRGHGHGAAEELSPRGRRASSRRRGSAGEVFDKLANPAHFTGSHKHRFDKHGNGLGLAGRDFVSKGKGTAPSRANPGAIQDISQIMRTGHHGHAVDGLDDHPGFRTPSSPRRSPRGKQSPRRHSSESATSRRYDDERDHRQYDPDIDDDEWAYTDGHQEDAEREEPDAGRRNQSGEGKDTRNYDSIRDRRLEEELQSRGNYGQYGEDHDEYTISHGRRDSVDGENGRRHESRSRHGNGDGGIIRKERRASRIDHVTEPALGYPSSRHKRSTSASRSRRPSSSPADRSHTSTRSFNVGRGSFASGEWVSAAGVSSPRPDGKKSATDRRVQRAINAKREMEAREERELEQRRLKMEEKARQGERRAKAEGERRIASRR